MEKIIYTCMTTLLIAFSGSAQSSYEEGMQKALELWDKDQPTKAVLLFEELAESEKDNWLPYYYASEIKIVKAFGMKDAVKKEQQLEEAQLLLDKAAEYGGKDNVENMVLQAMLHTAYITLDPGRYGGALSPVVISIYDMAAKKSPENPRVALSRVEWNMGSARYFGTDPKQYCEELRESLELFAKDSPEGNFAPSWGEERAMMLLNTICEN